MSAATIGTIIGTALALLVSAGAHYRATMAMFKADHHAADPAAHTPQPPR